MEVDGSGSKLKSRLGDFSVHHRLPTDLEPPFDVDHHTYHSAFAALELPAPHLDSPRTIRTPITSPILPPLPHPDFHRPTSPEMVLKAALQPVRRGLPRSVAVQGYQHFLTPLRKLIFDYDAEAPAQAGVR